MDGTLLLASGTALLAGLGALESAWHRRYLQSIPLRIHVNGTRGKSAVTRLIAAGLRAGGIRTCAKTTGTLPRMIFPDGSEYPIFRPARANIIEQTRVVRAAARAGTQALVVECMALQPALQSLCELKLVRATHGVITNARADHLDVMGPDVHAVARALAGTVPVGGKLFTAEQDHLPTLRAAARDRHSQLIAVGRDEVNQVPWDELNRFSYIEHAENVALALRVCQDAGVDRQTALRGMWQARPDVGVMRVYSAPRTEGEFLFVNGFAANDPDSTGRIWQMILDRYWHVDRRIAVINCRADRSDRTQQLAEACRQWPAADRYLVTGTATHLFARRAVAHGLDRERIECFESAELAPILAALERAAGHRTLVMGMGNIAGPGMQLVEHFERLAQTAAPVHPASTRRAA